MDKYFLMLSNPYSACQPQMQLTSSQMQPAHPSQASYSQIWQIGSNLPRSENLCLSGAHSLVSTHPGLISEPARHWVWCGMPGYKRGVCSPCIFVSLHSSGTQVPTNKKSVSLM